MADFKRIEMPIETVRRLTAEAVKCKCGEYFHRGYLLFRSVEKVALLSSKVKLM